MSANLRLSVIAAAVMLLTVSGGAVKTRLSDFGGNWILGAVAAESGGVKRTAVADTPAARAVKRTPAADTPVVGSPAADTAVARAAGTAAVAKCRALKTRATD